MLLVLPAAAALEVLLHQAQRASLPVQQTLRQVQLIPEPGQVQIEVRFLLQPLGEGGDPVGGHIAGQGSEAPVGEEGGDIIRQTVAFVEGHLGDAHPAGALPLVQGDGQLLDPLHHGEVQHQIVLLAVHPGREIQRLRQQDLPLVVPGGHLVAVQGVFVVPAQIGDQDGIVHILGLPEGIGEVAVQAPVLGDPVGGRIVVEHVCRGEVGAQRRIDIVGICHHN